MIVRLDLFAAIFAQTIGADADYWAEVMTEAWAAHGVDVEDTSLYEEHPVEDFDFMLRERVTLFRRIIEESILARYIAPEKVNELGVKLYGNTA